MFLKDDFGLEMGSNACFVSLNDDDLLFSWLKFVTEDKHAATPPNIAASSYRTDCLTSTFNMCFNSAMIKFSLYLVTLPPKQMQLAPKRTSQGAINSAKYEHNSLNIFSLK